MTTWHISVSNSVLWFTSVVLFTILISVYLETFMLRSGKLYVDVAEDRPVTAAVKIFLRNLFWGLLLVNAFWVVDLARALGYNPFTWSSLRSFVTWSAAWAVFSFLMAVFLNRVVVPWQIKQDRKKESKAEQLRRESGYEIHYSDDDDDRHTPSTMRGP